MPFTAADAIQEIDELLLIYQQNTSKSRHENWADLAESLRVEVVSRTLALIMRLAPPGSTYIATLQQQVGGYPPLSFSTMYIRQLPGVLKALRADYSAGRLQPVKELIHSDLFSDFLEMADHLVEEGYKDAAAVLAGGVLEEHLRKLCEKSSISATQAGRPKKAEAMNSDLASASAYPKLDQKNVTAWLDLRNKAAHAKYAEYTAEQVRLLIQSLRDFLTRIPA
jgi:hypothetical protein